MLKVLAVLLAFSVPAEACTLTIAIVTVSPTQNLTKTWNDTDANCVLMLQALQDATSNPATPNPTPGQAALMWAQGIVNNLIVITTAFQKKSAPTTPVNPQ